ncbi:DUF547 domain-containing protein [Winogradskyella bathintestinalis]|uniref:DUF547 domain-containing protein n=1 Tax=Winogradskyella bathintestinalis TaxID=3035208 RepID=A0ABT7ZQ93_9FLAO|nr:DUF547 domain-containing protein [Winogradskyella bathintestinalis]MDN3491182.1 DUF547 domain-containing protein [Winogradskyella bathintestinalis]
MKYFARLIIIVLIFSNGNAQIRTLKQTTEVAKIETNVSDTSDLQNLTEQTRTEHQLWDEILKRHVSEDGKVDYAGFKTDYKNLQNYIGFLQNLYKKKILTTESSKDESLTFWINAYNALTIDLILRNYPTKSIKDIKDPWDQRLWKFGDEWQNLNDIEHKILREMNEPRIHFAIVCASISCPKLQNEAFTASNLDDQLTNATKEFLADTSKNEISQNSLKISKIFKWFKKDFEQKGSLIDFINEFVDIEISQSAKVRYKDYDWGLNN